MMVSAASAAVIVSAVLKFSLLGHVIGFEGSLKCTGSQTLHAIKYDGGKLIAVCKAPTIACKGPNGPVPASEWTKTCSNKPECSSGEFINGFENTQMYCCAVPKDCPAAAGTRKEAKLDPGALLNFNPSVKKDASGKEQPQYAFVQQIFTSSDDETRRKRQALPSFTVVIIEIPGEAIPTIPTNMGPSLIDVVIVLDASRSVEAYYDQEKSIAEKIVNGLHVEESITHVSLVRFSGPGSATVDYSFKDKQDTTSIVKNIQSAAYLGGSTFLSDALDLAAQQFTPANGARNGVDKVAFILSDALSQQDPTPGAIALKQAANEIYSITAGPFYNAAELAKIVNSLENIYCDSKVSTLDSKLTSMKCSPRSGPQITVSGSCGQSVPPNSIPVIQQVVPASNTNPPSTAGIGIAVPTTSLVVPTTSLIVGQTQPQALTTRPVPQPVSGSAVDLLIILDTSGSEASQFAQEVTLAQAIINGLQISDAQAHVAIVRFGGTATMAYSFKQKQDKDAILTTLQKIRFTGGTTALGDALNRGAAQLTNQMGARDGVSKVVVVFTDGFTHLPYTTGIDAIHSAANTVFVVGPGPANNIEVMNLIAGDSNRVYIDSKISTFVSSFQTVVHS